MLTIALKPLLIISYVNRDSTGFPVTFTVAHNSLPFITMSFNFAAVSKAS